MTSSRKPGGQPGNHNAQKHGRYARTPDLATQLFFPASKYVRTHRDGVLSHSQRTSFMRTILIEGVPVRVPSSAEMATLNTLPTEEYLARVKRLWVIMALDLLKHPDLPIKDVLYLVRKIIMWSKK
jgi:hypothetical protein